MTPADTRMYIAAQALNGMLSARSADWDIGDDKRYTARESVHYADALMKALAEIPAPNFTKDAK